LPPLDAKASGLILYDFEGDLWVLSLPEGTRSRLTNDGAANQKSVQQGFNRSPVWSPDSLQIAFASARDVYQQPNYKGGTEIYTMRPDGSQIKRITQGPEGVYVAKTPLAWLPNGEILVSQADVSGTANPTGGPVAPVVLLDPNTGQIRGLPVKVSEGNVYPAFGISPDKTQMAYVVGKADPQTKETKLELYTAPLAGEGQPKSLATLPPMRLATASALVWSPDGQSVIVSEAEGDACGSFTLYSVGKNGGTARPLTSPAVGFPLALSYAPAGKWLTYSGYSCQGQPGTNPKLFLLDTEKGGKALEITEGSNPSYGRKISA
jgi:Tol biopolymer transport system component